MKPNRDSSNKTIKEVAKVFAENFVKNGEYPDTASKIEVSVYSVENRDIL